LKLSAHGSRYTPLRSLLVALSLTFYPARAEAAPPEYQVKAEFLERFARFVDWPDSAFSSPTAPFVLCVMGQNRFGEALDTLSQRRIKGRPVKVLVLTLNDDALRCHQMFIDSSVGPRLSEVLNRIRGKPILTVSDTPGFAEAGVQINLFLESSHPAMIRFEVNASMARKNGLRFSSGLLRLARLIGPEEGR
jgi:hypothetical protein